MKITVQIAGFYIQIIFHDTTEGIYAREKLKKEILTFTKKFQTSYSGPYDYSISFVNMDFFKAIFHGESGNTYFSSFVKKKEGEIKTYYEISIFQFQLLLKLILYELLTKNGGCILHSSSILYKNKAILFLGHEGAGKSTIIRLLKDVYRPLSDDTSLIKKVDGAYWVYQWPIVEKQWWVKKKNEAYLLEKFFFIKQSKKTESKQLHDTAKIFEQMYSQLMIDEKDTKHYISFTRELMESFEKFHTLFFEMNEKKLIHILKAGNQNEI